MVNPIIEVCANSVESCIEAQRGGAYRVELCSSIPEGGTTPSIGAVEVARDSVSIKLNVIIRPRSGDFCYSDLEVRTMIGDIEALAKIGVDGVVFGCLNADGSVDVAKNKLLMDAAGGMSTTFHRAIDLCGDQFSAIEQIIELGFDRLLTSGGEQTALQGVGRIADLVDLFGDRIVIMPGSGVNEDNVAWLARKTRAIEFHSSARVMVDSVMKYRVDKVSMGGVVTVDEFNYQVTSAHRVEKMIKELRNV